MTERSCCTCLYRATHEKCEGCLHPEGWVGERVVIFSGPNGENPTYGKSYAYANWKESSLGEALERQHQLEVSGEWNIVIGGSGEAEVNALWSPREAYEHLYKVSCACGYYTKSPTFYGDEARIWIAGSWNGPRILVWKSGVLERIEKENGVCTWERHPEHIKTVLGRAYEMKGTPKAMMV